jgi:hypothetical protein
MTEIETNLAKLGSGDPDKSGLVAEPQFRPPISGLQARRSYFIRHWRGQLSLPVSYWINSVLGTVSVLFVSTLVGALVQPTESLLTWAFLIFTVWIFAIVVTIWQLVGVWRSAGNHKSRGGSGFWAGAARFMVCLGFLSLAGTLFNNAIPQLAGVLRIAAGDKETGDHTLKILRDGTELEFSGGITFGIADEVQRILDIAPSIKVIHLNSSGGRVAEARKLRDLISERRLITYTSTTCASACTIAFLGGRQRYMAADARIGFHQVDFPGLSREELIAENENERRRLIEQGVPAWFADRAYSTPNNSMWWPSADILMQANVVTEVARSSDFALSGAPRDLDSDKLEAGLLKVPTFAAIKRAEPETYAKILAAMMDAVKRGKSQTELNAVTLPFVANVTKKYLPVASGDAVIEMTKVLVAEMDAIASKDPVACYHFINPRPSDPSVSVADYISGELKNRDLAASAAVIETGSIRPQRVPAEAEVSGLMDRAVLGLSRKYNAEDIATLSDLNSPKVNRQKVCGIASGLYREVLMLPVPDQARLLRYMFAQ